MSDDPTFRELLEDELMSTVMPQRDPVVSSPDELVRDIHKLLAGNGSIAKGLVFKVASTTAQVKLLEQSYSVLCNTVNDTAKLLKKHLEDSPKPVCAYPESEMPRSVTALERMALGSFVLALWRYRVLIGIAALAIISVVNNRDISDAQRQIYHDSAVIKRSLQILTATAGDAQVAEAQELPTLMSYLTNSVPNRGGTVQPR